MIQPDIFSRFSQPVHFSMFKPDNLLLSTARFSCYNLEKCTGWLNLEKARLDRFKGIDLFPNLLIYSGEAASNSWRKLYADKSLDKLGILQEFY